MGAEIDVKNIHGIDENGVITNIQADELPTNYVEVGILHDNGAEVSEDERIIIDLRFGAKGDTPIKGVDYMTPEDVEAIKQEVKESIDEEYADEIEQISVPITPDMRELRIDYRCRKKPRAKVLIKTADGYQEAMAAVDYIGVNTVRVSWSKAIEGELIIN